MGAQPEQEWSPAQIDILTNGFADGLTDFDIAERTGKTEKAVSAKRARMKLFREPRGAPPKAIPADLADKRKVMTIVELRKHYKCSSSTLTRWLREGGIPERVYIRPTKIPKPKPKSAQQYRRPVGSGLYRGPKLPPVTIEDSREARAARFLMRSYKPVCRARTVNPKADKDLWIVGRVTLTSGELIDKATSDPAWPRWAA